MGCVTLNQTILQSSTSPVRLPYQDANGFLWFMISFVQYGPTADYSPVDRPTFEGLKTKAKTRGVLIPAGDDGSVTGIVEADYHYNETALKLTIRVIHKPIFISHHGIFDQLGTVFNS